MALLEFARLIGGRHLKGWIEREVKVFKIPENQVIFILCLATGIPF